MKKLANLIILSRPLNCLITFCSVWIGAVVAGETFASLRILIASLSWVFIAAYGYIVNDLFDIEVDKIARAHRPLARGAITRTDAVFAAVFCAIVGLGLSAFVHLLAFGVTFSVIIALFAYTPIFKGRSYLGNVLVAVISSLAFVIGGLAVDKPFGAAFLVLFAFLVHLGREIVKDIQDRAADYAVGYRTGAVRFDTRLSRGLAVSVLGFLLAATFIPAMAGIYAYGYLVAVMISVDLILVESIHRLIKSDDETSMRRVSAWLKLAMPFGLLAVLLGRLGF